MENNDIINELGQNFIEYAVSVNTDRAIPDATSGLKPVHRRILWSSYKEGRSSDKPHVKCALIYGDVMGKYHPHGDSSIYGALVRLSQDWVMRYPLIDFHGSNGNIIGDGPAAARYTEARLAKITEEGMLRNIKKKNVDFVPNYSEDLEEPVTLPSIFPNLLCNPNTGIGVAMACNWLPHNLNEVAQAIYDYLDGKEPMLPGPDFPTGGTIINMNDASQYAKVGRGSVKIRGNYRIEKQNIIFYEIPYGTTIEGLLQDIGKACDEKVIEGIEEIRDETNKKGIRLVIECRKGINPEAIVAKLFAKTNLQTSVSYNQVALLDKTPTELTLAECIDIYINHNRECLLKETMFDLLKIKDRLEIVDGLLIALEDIDNVIKAIKQSEFAAAAKDYLKLHYKLTDNQAKAILDMKLAKLAKLEKIELENEKRALEESKKSLQNILGNETEQTKIIRERLEYIVKKYGDERRTQLAQIEIPKEEKEIVEVIPEDCVIVMTQTGDIKRVATNSFKVQKRNGKGVKSEDDAILDTISTNTIDNLMIFTNKGKMYKILVDKIPAGTNASRGIQISSLINLEPSEKVIAISSLKRKTDAEYVVFFTKQGLIKKTALEEYKSIKKSTGTIAIKLKEGDSIANVTFLKEEEVMIITKNGMSIRFETKDIAAIGRNTSGVKSIKLNDGDEVLVGLPIHKETDTLAVFSSKGMAKKTKLDEFPIQGRGGKGLLASQSNIIGAAMVSDEDNILLVGKPNGICVSAKEIPLLSRTSLGNSMIKNSEVKRIVKI